MPVAAPGRRLLASVPFGFVRARSAGRARRPVSASLNLVSFIDFLVTMVVFLITSFSAEGSIGTSDPLIRPPTAAHATAIELAPIIAVNREAVTIDGRFVADTPSLGAPGAPPRIDALVRDLATQKRSWQLLHPRRDFPGTVVIQADREIDFRVIRLVMRAAAEAGYGDVSFAVRPAAIR